MRTLIIGGTGKVGSAIVASLLDQEVDVAVLTKSAERRQLVPEGTQVVIGDLIADPDTMREAFRDIDAVYMVNKASATEAVEGMMAVRLAQEAGVRRFVYQTAHLLDDLAYLPHLGAKVAIRAAIKASDMEYSFVAPNHFFQNDLLVQRPLLDRGVYLTPLGAIGCDGVDTADIAAVAVKAMLSEDASGRTHVVVGPDRLVSGAAAEIWSDALGRDVRVGSMAEWATATKPFMPTWMHYDLALMYADFAERGMCGTAEDLAEVTAYLGRPPRTYREFVADFVAQNVLAN